MNSKNKILPSIEGTKSTEKSQDDLPPHPTTNVLRQHNAYEDHKEDRDWLAMSKASLETKIGDRKLAA